MKIILNKGQEIHVKEGYFVIKDPATKRQTDDTINIQGAAINVTFSVTVYENEEKGPSTSIAYGKVSSGASVFVKVDDDQPCPMEDQKYIVLRLEHESKAVISIPAIADGEVTTGKLTLEIFDEGLSIFWNF